MADARIPDDEGDRRMQGVGMAGGGTGLARLFHGRMRVSARGTIVAPAFAAPASGALAQSNVGALGGFSDFLVYGSATIVILLGVVVFATVTAIVYIRERGRWARGMEEAAAEITTLRKASDQAALLLGAEPQFVAAFAGEEGEPEIVGDTARVTGGASGRRALAFGAWMPSRDARTLEEAAARLRSRGDSFLIVLSTLNGSVVEAEGRAIAGRAVLRIRDVGPERSARQKVEARLAEAESEIAAIRAAFDAMPHPIWLKDRQRRLVWVNLAYAQAVEAADRGTAVSKGLDIVDARQRLTAERALDSGHSWRDRTTAVLGGKRAMLDVAEATSPHGGGIAVDMTELDQVRADLERQMQSHVGTLDQLPTAVAIFNQSQRLVFHNQAYRDLWNLDPAFLATSPKDGEILEFLRSQRRLPEQADFAAWKRQMLDAYRSLENRELGWHLPDRRALRVVVRPNPQGGVTYLFDDVSEDMELRSQVTQDKQVRRETFNALKEGVFVFGSDGRLRLFNKAAAKMWKLPKQVLKLHPHIDEICRLARIQAPDSPFWDDLKGAVAGLPDRRTGVRGRIDRRDEASLDCVASPLPDGATLVTFTDVTASVRAERALKERNEALNERNAALEKTGKVRDEFIQHVSYELRSPLTTVIGFAQLLDDPGVGPLNARQSEYIDHIKRSSGALLTIVNDILDLQTIDMGALELRPELVDIREIFATVRAGVQDRLVEAEVDLVFKTSHGLKPFEADPKRLRQVLFNLVTNAIGFSTHGQMVRVEAASDEELVRLTVSDSGRGIPEDMQAKVFERFESYTRGSRHRGVGLGLPIVRAFVEAHGGTVSLQSAAGLGTTVTCTFPTRLPAKKPTEETNDREAPPPAAEFAESRLV